MGMFSRAKIFGLGVAAGAVLLAGAGAAKAQYFSWAYSNEHWNSERLACTSQGGRWDWDNGICYLPNQTSWRYDATVSHTAPTVRGHWYNGTYYVTH